MSILGPDSEGGGKMEIKSKAVLQSRVGGFVGFLTLGTVPLTPFLFLIKLAMPEFLTWTTVFLPWLGGLHLLVSWRTAQLFVQFLWSLFHSEG